MQEIPVFFKGNTVADRAVVAGMFMIDCKPDKRCVKFPSPLAGAAARAPQPTVFP
jgi:hypothetical protein